MRPETSRKEQWTPRISVSSFTETEFPFPVRTRKMGKFYVSIILSILVVYKLRCLFTRMVFYRDRL